MVFGEIVEPSSRALLEDEYADYPENSQSVLEWQGLSEVPHIVNTILIAETVNVNMLLRSCLLNKEPRCSLKNGGTEVFSIENDAYVILYKPVEEVLVGEVTEKLVPWINKAKNIFTITSAPLALYQKSNVSEKITCVMRSLTSKPATGDHRILKLEVPNLVTGLGANVLSYCVHTGRLCTLFIGYIDAPVLDSINAKLFLDLLKNLNIGPLKTFISEIAPPVNNLYM